MDTRTTTPRSNNDFFTTLILFATLILLITSTPSITSQHNTPIYRVTENQPNGTYLGDLKNDLDATNASSFHLLSTNLTYFSIDSLFRLHSTTGKLYTNSILDLESLAFTSYRRFFSWVFSRRFNGKSAS